MPPKSNLGYSAERCSVKTKGQPRKVSSSSATGRRHEDFQTPVPAAEPVHSYWKTSVEDALLRLQGLATDMRENVRQLEYSMEPILLPEEAGLKDAGREAHPVPLVEVLLTLEDQLVNTNAQVINLQHRLAMLGKLSDNLG